MAHWVACHGCGSPAPNKGGWCGQCSTVYRDRRTWRWAQYVRAYIRAHPECEICGATEDLTLDHRTPVTRGGSMWSPDNHRVLCRSCNSGQAHN